jgi:hypothetical protein
MRSDGADPRAQHALDDFLYVLGDTTVSPSMRRKLRKLAEGLPGIGIGADTLHEAAEVWGRMAPEERERRMDKFLARLEEDRFVDRETGPDQLLRALQGRPPQGALPVPDDTPFADPPRRRAPE